MHGDQFKRGDFPWIVALLYTGFSPPSYFCGGSLISSRHVVTGKIFQFFIDDKPQIIFFKPHIASNQNMAKLFSTNFTART